MDLIPTRVCGAKTNSGHPCKRTCAPGFTRCNLHGGHTPQARLAAVELLAKAAIPASAALLDILSAFGRERCDSCGMPTGDPAPVLRAAQIVLDRTGFPAGIDVKVAAADTAPPPWVTLLPWIPDERFELMHQWLQEAADAKRRNDTWSGEASVEAELVDAPVAGDEP